MTTKRQPKGIPVGGEFAANEHDEASASLAPVLTRINDPRYIPGVSQNDDDMTDAEWFEAMGEPENPIDHNTLMDIGDVRMMPTSSTVEIVGDVTVVRDEESGIEKVYADIARDQFGNTRDYESDEDRVSFLAQYDKVAASAERVFPTDNDDGWRHYQYEVTLHNPYTDETILTSWSAGLAHENTPHTDEVLGSMVSDAASVHGRDIDEWADEMGYEPDYDDESFHGDAHYKHRQTYDACVEIDEKLQSFLGRRYDDYMWGDPENGTLDVEFRDENAKGRTMGDLYG